MPGTRDGSHAAAPTAAEVRAALARILGSRCFGQAGRASDFLRFVVEQTLTGHGRNLKGYVIATAVFGRPADFDAQSDPLVRVEAGRLRRRLAEYYASEGEHDAVRLSLPRGQYAPEWHYTAPPAAEAVRPPPAPAAPAASADARRWRQVSVALATALALAVAALAWREAASPSERASAVALVAAMDDDDRVPLIVAPFDNLSGEPMLDRSAAALTEEVILRLDRLDVLVLAAPAGWHDERGSNLAVDDSGYVLTGSIRSAGDHARITVRLVAAGTGELLWSAAYQQPPKPSEQAAFHERMAFEIATAASPYGPLYEAELARARNTSSPNPGLRDCIAAYYQYRRRPTPDAQTEARGCFERVVERRPELAGAWAGIALLDLDRYGSYFGGDLAHGKELLRRARKAVDTAERLESQNARAALARTRLLYFEGHPDFLTSVDRVLSLDPENSETLAVLGTLLVVSGHPERGLRLVDRAVELTPNPPGHYEIARAAAHLMNGDAEQALEAAQHIGAPTWYAMPLFIAAAAGLAGQEEVAARALNQLRAIDPDFERTMFARLRKWRYDPVLCRALIAGLTAAGANPAAPVPLEGG
jgi:adenylate cyclase